MSMDDTLKVIRLEGELQGATARIMQLRTYLAGALCGVCGEPLGDGDDDIVLQGGGDDVTVHRKCEETDPS